MFQLIIFLFSVTRVYCPKKNSTGLITNYLSFNSYSYKVGLIRTLADRTCKVKNIWLGLQGDIAKLMKILKKNPLHY